MGSSEGELEGCQLMTAMLPETATRTWVGALGMTPAKKRFENVRGDDASPLLSVAVKTYWRPSVSPMITQLVLLTAVHVAPPGWAVAV